MAPIKYLRTKSYGSGTGMGQLEHIGREFG